MFEKSPFSLNRFEHEYEGKHLYFLPPSFFPRLEIQKPVYLVGSRGTGKTTLLHGLNWKERATNESLQKEIGEEPLACRYIGVYFYAPDFQAKLLDGWLEKTSESVKAQIFGMYFELILIFLIADALANLIATGELVAKTEDEHHVLQQIYEREPRLLHGHDKYGSYTFNQFAKFVNKLRVKLVNHALNSAEVDKIQKEFPICGFGELSRIVTPLFANFLNNIEKPVNKPWYFKVCVDETETLDSFQQRVLNTLVRVSRHPLFLVLAFVRQPDDISKTFIPNLTLQQADRDIVNLDKMTDLQFREFVEGVASIRIREDTGNYNLTFNTEKMFGKLDLNQLIKSEVLGRSEGSLAKEFLSDAKTFLKTCSNDESVISAAKNELTKLDNKVSLPIYEAYLVKKLRINMLSAKDPNWKKRQQQSAEIRKRMVAAYLSICNDLKQKVRYAYAEMILQMSDKCIRDFLAQLNEAYLEVKKPIAEFINFRIPLRDQDKALRLASEKKQNSIPESGIRSPESAGKLIEALSRLTTIVQTRSRNLAHIRSNERGRFVLNITGADKSDNKLLQIIKDAAEAGFLRIIFVDSPKWIFQVHCSLAAAYGFSYRGAYYNTIINLTDLETIIKAQSKKEFKEILKRLGDQLAGEKPKSDIKQMELFKDD